MNTAALPVNVMVKTNSELYQSANGFTARIEFGNTPNGNPVSGRWVLRDVNGTWVDFDQYRHNLFERNGLRTDY